MNALLFYGNSPFISKKGYILEYLDKNKYYCFESIKKHIIDKNINIKIFFHTWDINISNIEYLIECYKPEKYISEEYTENNIIYSYTSSMNKVNLLKCEYEKENNIIFDNVILCRYDLIWTTDLILNEINNKKFTISYWGTDIDKNYNFNNLYDNTNFKGIHNLFFISNSYNMNIFCNLYNELNKYEIDNIPITFHIIERYHLEKTGLIDIIEFKFIVGTDLEIESRCFFYDTPGYNNIGKKILDSTIKF
jgi:hypothetical protein